MIQRMLQAIMPQAVAAAASNDPKKADQPVALNKDAGIASAFKKSDDAPKATGAAPLLSAVNSVADSKVSSNEEYTLERLEKEATGPRKCLVGIFGKVYNLYSFLGRHPGGEAAISYRAGQIINDVFTEDGNHREFNGNAEKVEKSLARYKIYPIGRLKL